MKFGRASIAALAAAFSASAEPAISSQSALTDVFTPMRIKGGHHSWDRRAGVPAMKRAARKRRNRARMK